jgi:hypothetical protein
MCDELSGQSGSEAIRMDVVQWDYWLRQRQRASHRRKHVMAEDRHLKLGSREQRRKQMKVNLLSVCKSMGVKEGKEKTLAVFSLQTGLSVERLAVYLDELVQAGLISVEGDEIRIPQAAATKLEEESHDR